MAFEGRTLGDVVTLVRGTTYKSALLGQPGPVLLGLASIQRNGGFRSDSLKTYGGESKEKILLRPGDLFVSLKDVTQSADLLGSIARVPTEVALGRLTQDTVKLEFREDSYPPALVYWTLRSPNFRSYCRAHATGTTNLGLPREDFLAYQLPVPAPEVLSLVQLLEDIEKRITLLSQTNATLEAIAQALFKSWFVDFDPVRAKAEGREPEGMDAPTAALFPSGFEESELGPIPNGWSCSRFGELLAERSERVRTQEAIVMSAVQSGKLVRSDDHFNKRVHSADISKYKLVQPLSFAYNPSRINIGSIGLNEGGAIGAVSPIYVVAKATRSDVAYFVWHHLRTEAMKRRIVGLCSGSVRQSLSAADFFSLPIAIPDARLLSIFHSVRQSLYDKFRSNESQASLLADMRDTLLPRLISGKLRLPEVEAEVEAVA